MDPLGSVIVAVVVAAVLAWKVIEHRRRSARRGEILALAHTSGMQYTRHDTMHLGWLPFALFGKGDERGIDNVLHGTVDDIPVWVFDYWYVERSRDHQGRTSETTHRFTCARVDAPGMRFPKTRITPETALSRFADAVGIRDLQFESDEFNRAFKVETVDRKFAYDLIDARMMRWLLLTRPHRLSFELNDQHILLVAGELPASQFLLLAAIARDLVARIPDVAHELYGVPRTAPGDGR